ncbi:MAG: DNA polymerase III subunit delta' [Burkholderiaceae bacterium]|nr:DNA polymerase III subunit delta' [Burkholderiaceae bacterium]
MSAYPQFLPWQQATASAWLSQRERFAHAWLIHGLPGIGKSQFALAAAASLLCEQPVQGLACGHCTACLWLASGNHPDIRRIRPDAIALEEGAQEAGSDEDVGTSATTAKKVPSKEIRVEQLRSLNSWFNTATHRGGWRVAVLYPAQALNVISANALLKVLEEPPRHTVFLLVADAPDRLLPTLVSRCRRLPLSVPDVELSVSWLEQQGLAQPSDWLSAAGGAPLLALELSRSREQACPDWLAMLAGLIANAPRADIGPVADLLEKQPAVSWIDNLQRLFVDITLVASQEPIRYFPALSATVGVAAARASMINLLDMNRWLAQQRAVAGHPLNPKLFIHAALQRAVLACA